MGCPHLAPLQGSPRTRFGQRVGCAVVLSKKFKDVASHIQRVLAVAFINGSWSSPDADLQGGGEGSGVWEWERGRATHPIHATERLGDFEGLWSHN